MTSTVSSAVEKLRAQLLAHLLARKVLPNSQELLNNMKSYNLLISHSWKYSDAYDRLVALLKNRGYFDFKNYSVPRIDPIVDAVGDRALERAIRDQMRPCHAVLILGGVYATYSKWINKEIALAKEFQKPIIGINLFGATNSSTVVQDNADIMVNWNADSIVNAIRTLA
ncbi:MULTISPECIES: TIR domain-containing protein [Burkholderia]|nr:MULTISPECIES: TIR domain-containing protein [Burkholderia]